EVAGVEEDAVLRREVEQVADQPVVRRLADPCEVLELVRGEEAVGARQRAAARDERHEQRERRRREHGQHAQLEAVEPQAARQRVGSDEAYVQQEEADQEVEFQKACTLELSLSLLFTVLIAIAAPVLVAVYDDDRLLALTLAVSYLPIAFALQAPLWIFFRRMDFIRQRSLQAVVPVATFLVTIPVVLATDSVWSLVVGAFAGNVAAVILSIRLSP